MQSAITFACTLLVAQVVLFAAIAEAAEKVFMRVSSVDVPLPAKKSEKHNSKQSNATTNLSDTRQTKAEDSWSTADVTKALRSCLRKLAPISAEIVVRQPTKKGKCGAVDIIELRSLTVRNKITFDPSVEINCAVVVALHDWFEVTVQPTALEELGTTIVAVRGGGGYQCRRRNRAKTGKLSEHAFANAIDIPVFVAKDGQSIAISTHWGPTTRRQQRSALIEKKVKAKSQPATTKVTKPQSLAVGVHHKKKASFLRRLHSGACKRFGTVLGPEADDAHLDHFHLDLATRRSKSYCQ